MAAERDAKDRYIAQFLEDKIGAEFGARISGVTKSGLFITLDETGADGLIPVNTWAANIMSLMKSKNASSVKTAATAINLDAACR